MTWWKGDDGWDDCDALNGLADADVAIFMRAQARMGRLLTDGVLTEGDFERIDLSRSRADRAARSWRESVDALVHRGVLVVDGDGWLDPGWLTRNPSKAEIEAQRRWDALRQQISYATTRKDESADIEALKEKAEAAKLALWRIRRDRKSASLTSETTSDSRSDSLRPVQSPSRPVPIGVDEDETPVVEPIASEPRSTTVKKKPTVPPASAVPFDGAESCRLCGMPRLPGEPIHSGLFDGVRAEVHSRCLRSDRPTLGDVVGAVAR